MCGGGDRSRTRRRVHASCMKGRAHVEEEIVCRKTQIVSHVAARLPVAISRDDARCAAQLLYNGTLTCGEYAADNKTCLSYFIHVDVTPTPAWATTASVRNHINCPAARVCRAHPLAPRVSVLVLRANALDVTTQLGVA